MKIYLYIIRAGRASKIGITNNVQKRLLALQTAHYEKLTVYHAFECKDLEHAQKIEQFLHHQYKDFRIRGEWYRLTIAQLSTIKREWKATHLPPRPIPWLGQTQDSSAYNDYLERYRSLHNDDMNAA